MVARRARDESRADNWTRHWFRISAKFQVVYYKYTHKSHFMAPMAEVFSLALQHHQAGRLPEAEALYRQILQAQPDHPDALHLLGMIAYQVGKHEVAVEYVKQAIALNPSVAEFHNNLGTVYIEL